MGLNFLSHLGITLLLLRTIQMQFPKLLLWETELSHCFHTIKTTNKTVATEMLRLIVTVMYEHVRGRSRGFVLHK